MKIFFNVNENCSNENCLLNCNNKIQATYLVFYSKEQMFRYYYIIREGIKWTLDRWSGCTDYIPSVEVA